MLKHNTTVFYVRNSERFQAESVKIYKYIVDKEAFARRGGISVTRKLNLQENIVSVVKKKKVCKIRKSLRK